MTNGVATMLRREFEREMHATRRLLAATPFAAAAWQPHARSLPVARLAAHLADIPRWIPAIIGGDHYDVAASRPPAASAEGLTALLARFDANVRAALDSLDTAGPQALDARWDLQRGTGVIGAFTRAQSVRLFVIHHVVHHRAQLALYLLLLDAPVPPDCEPLPRLPA